MFVDAEFRWVPCVASFLVVGVVVPGRHLTC